MFSPDAPNMTPIYVGKDRDSCFLSHCTSNLLSTGLKQTEKTD